MRWTMKYSAMIALPNSDAHAPAAQICGCSPPIGSISWWSRSITAATDEYVAAGAAISYPGGLFGTEKRSPG